MYKTAGSTKTTTDRLNKTFQAFAPWETFMTDGGRHFDNKIYVKAGEPELT